MSDDPRWPTAVHEAGHAVAAHFLGIGIQEVSIVPDGDTAGHVKGRRRVGHTFREALETADYECSYGGFVNARTRKRVESTVMYVLAGAEAQIALGCDADVDEGIGIIELTTEEAERIFPEATEHEGLSLLHHHGDLADAINLTEKLSGGEEEASAYLSWLTERTKSLMCHPTFLPAVEAVAARLLEAEELTGKEVRETIEHAQQQCLERMALSPVEWLARTNRGIT